MNSTAQILLVVMLLVLGSTLTLIGVQVFLILRDVREGVVKVNGMLEDTKAVTKQLAEGAQDLRRAASSPWAVVGGIAGIVRSFMRKDS